MSTYNTVPWMVVDDNGYTGGNGYITHTCQGPYKGRVQRTGHTSVTTFAATPATAVVNFIQLAHSEYVEFDQSSYNATKDGGEITITGRTNAPRLDFAITVDADSIGTLPTYFSIDGVTFDQVVGGQVFVGDPGATGEIEFTIKVTIASNDSIDSRYCTLTATGSTGVTGSTNIIQAANASYINLTSEHLSQTTITFDANGLSGGESSVDVDVYSNDDWSITVQ